MPDLSRELIEHRLSINVGFRPYKQGAQNFNPEIVRRVKKEVDRLLQPGFIQPCRYIDWISNIVPMEKNTGKIWICVDIRNLNCTTPKDKYSMPVPDLLIDSASGNKVINFLDGNAGYNQIFMAKEDVSKTAFHYSGFVGLFEWVVITFGLKNAGATYQRAMNLIFNDLLGVLMEVYIDKVVIKSIGIKDHMTDLKLSLERMKKYGLRKNPLKCAFGVTLGKFLGFVVHEHGIQIDPKKIESISKIGESVCKKDIQKLLGKINYLRCLYLTLQGGWNLCYHWFGSNTRRSSLGGRIEVSLRQDQGILGDTSRVTSFKGRKPVQDVHCPTRTGYRSCSTTRRGWQGVFDGIHESTSSRC
jgi:hypothetical protein